MTTSLENSAIEAAATGNLPKLQSLKDEGYQYLDGIAEVAASYNRPEVLQWMIEEKVDIDPVTIANICVHYKFKDLLVLLEKQDILPDVDGLNLGAGNGDLELLKYYAKLNLLPNHDGAWFALAEGQHDTARWLASQGVFPN